MVNEDPFQIPDSHHSEQTLTLPMFKVSNVFFYSCVLTGLYIMSTGFTPNNNFYLYIIWLLGLPNRSLI